MKNTLIKVLVILLNITNTGMLLSIEKDKIYKQIDVEFQYKYIFEMFLDNKANSYKYNNVDPITQKMYFDLLKIPENKRELILQHVYFRSFNYNSFKCENIRNQKFNLHPEYTKEQKQFIDELDSEETYIYKPKYDLYADEEKQKLINQGVNILLMNFFYILALLILALFYVHCQIY
jgi:hypothetical protein